LKIEDIWGIGRQHAKRLHAINVNSAYDFTQLDDAWVKKYLAIVGIRLNGKYIPSKLFTTGYYCSIQYNKCIYAQFG
jgi:hypothetical protein